MDMYDVLPELQEMTAKSMNAVAPNELRRELGVASAHSRGRWQVQACWSCGDEVAEMATVTLTPGYPFTPLAFLTLVALLLVMAASHSASETALGIVVVLVGLPAYALFRRRPHALKEHELVEVD